MIQLFVPNAEDAEWRSKGSPGKEKGIGKRVTSCEKKATRL